MPLVFFKYSLSGNRTEQIINSKSFQGLGFLGLVVLLFFLIGVVIFVPDNVLCSFSVFNSGRVCSSQFSFQIFFYKLKKISKPRCPMSFLPWLFSPEGVLLFCILVYLFHIYKCFAFCWSDMLFPKGQNRSLCFMQNLSDRGLLDDLKVF